MLQETEIQEALMQVSLLFYQYHMLLCIREKTKKETWELQNVQKQLQRYTHFLQNALPQVLCDVQRQEMENYVSKIQRVLPS